MNFVNNQCLINGPYHLSRIESKVAPTGSSTSKNNLEDIHDAVLDKVLTDGSCGSLYVVIKNGNINNVVIKNGNINIFKKDDFFNSLLWFAPTDQVYYLRASSDSKYPNKIWRSNGQTVFSISGVDYEVSLCSHESIYAAYRTVLTAQVENRPPIRHLTPANRILELCNANNHEDNRLTFNSYKEEPFYYVIAKFIVHDEPEADNEIDCVMYPKNQIPRFHPYTNEPLDGEKIRLFKVYPDPEQGFAEEVDQDDYSRLIKSTQELNQRESNLRNEDINANHFAAAYQINSIDEFLTRFGSMAGQISPNTVLHDAILRLFNENSHLGIYISSDQELYIESLYNQVVTAHSEQTAREAESQKTGLDSNEIPIDLNYRVSQRQLNVLNRIILSFIQS